MSLMPQPSFSPDHIHPILVNFTAALLPASMASDVAGRIFKKPSLHHAAWWMLLYAAAITPFTALAGLLWKKSVASGVDPAILMTHQRLGIALGCLFIVMAVWRWSIYSRNQSPGMTYISFGILVVVALIYQGTLGGVMAFGP